MPRRLSSKPRTGGAAHLLRATVLATLCMVAAAASQAVVLGPVMLQSRSGEALNVEIPVRRFKAKELPGLTVRVGDDAAYAEAQLARPEIASQLQVELVPRGEYLRVRVRSAQPVTETRLDLVLVVRWQAGRVIRPFTLLLDGSGPLVAPVSSVVVSRGDTASRIALAHKGDDATLEQMLMAMLQANPDAFIDGNLNRLRVGAVLELPPRDAVAKLDLEQARELVITQDREFRLPHRSASRASQDTVEDKKRDTAAAETPPKASADSKAAPPKPASPAPTTARQAPSTQGAPADRLTLSKPVDRAQTQEREQKLAQLAREDAQRIDELQRNIAQLNQTIAELNRSVEALQRKSALAAEPGAGVPAPAASTVEAPAPAAPVAAPAPAPAAASVPAPLLEELLQHPATPWAGAGVMAFLLGVAMIRIRQRNRADGSTATPHDKAMASDFEPPAFDQPISILAATAAPAVGQREAHVTPEAMPSTAPAQGLPASVQGLSLDLDPLPTTLPASPVMPAAPERPRSDSGDRDDPGAQHHGHKELDDPMAVKLAVAEEFRSLGSLDAARDLAREVEVLADEPLKSRARDLLAQLG